MKTSLKLTVLFILLTSISVAQGIYNNGGKIVIRAGAVVHINGSTGNFRNETSGSNGEVLLSGSLIVKGNLTNNVTSAGIFTNPTAGSEVILSGSTAQTLGGTTTSGFVFDKLTINNSSGITLGKNALVNKLLTFQSGIISTDTNILTVGISGNVTGMSSTGYINGKMARVINVTDSTFVFPIGKGGNYRPLSINFSSLTGTSTILSEQVESLLPGPPPLNITFFADRYWVISQTGGTNLAFKLTLDAQGFAPTATKKMIHGDGATNADYDVVFSSPNYTNTIAFNSFSNFGVGVYCLPQVVAFTAIEAKTFGDGPFTVSATGGATGNPVIFTSSDTTVATCTGTNGTTITILKAGSSTISATQAGNEIYCQGVTTRVLTVNPKSITVTGLAGQTKVYGNVDPSPFTYTWTPSLVGSDSITGLMGRSAGESAAGYTFTVGTLTAGSNYALAVNATPVFTITPKPLKPVIVAAGKCFDGTVSASLTSQTLNGVISPDAVTLSVTSSAFANATAGAGKTVTSSGLSLSGTGAPNYILATATADTTAEIYPLPVPVITGTNPVCGDMTTVDYSTEAGKSNYAWVLSSGGSITAGADTYKVTIPWTTVGIHTLTVTYTDTNGCATATPTQKSIGVGPLPIVTISGPDTACTTHPGQVYKTEHGMTSYTWTVPGGGTITSGGTTTDSTVTVTWNTAGDQTVTVNYQNEYGCSALSDQVKNVKAISAPIPTINGPASVCAASTGNIYVTASGQSHYSWIVSPGGSIATGGTAADDSVTVTWNTEGTQSVSVNYRNSSGCEGASPAVKNVTVKRSGQVNKPENQIVCNNSASAEVQFTTINTGDSTNYIWTNSTTTIGLGASGSGNIASFTAHNSGTSAVVATITVTPTLVFEGAGCPGPDTTFTITVNPAITGNTSGQAVSVCNNTSTTLTGGNTSGGSGSYTWLWQSSDAPIGTFTAAAGTNNAANYNTDTLTSSSPHVYFRRIATSGGCTDTAAAVKVTVYDNFSVGSVGSAQSICHNIAAAQLTGTAPTGGNTPFTYQWQISTNNSAFTDIGGATTLSFQPAALTQTTSYRQVQGSAGSCGTQITDTVTITVYPNFARGSIDSSQSICYNTAAAELTGISPTGGNTPFGYQWQSSNNNSVFTDIAGATTLNFQPGTLNQTTFYRQVQSSANTCGALITDTVTVTVRTKFIAGAIKTTGDTICFNGDPSEIGNDTLACGGFETISYQWQKSTASAVAAYGDINGATTSGYDPPSGLTATTWYRRMAKEATCNPAFVNSNGVWKVLVNPSAVGGIATGGKPVCPGTNSTLLSLSGHTGSVQKWQSSVNDTSWTDIPGSSATTYTATNLTMKTYFRAIVASGDCQHVNSSATVITINNNFQISGYAKYDNNPKTPLNGLKVLLRKDSAIVDSVLTSSLGYYQFDSLTNGSFGLIIKSAHPGGNWQTWGGVNNTDYLLVAKHIAGTLFLPVNPPVVRITASVNIPHPLINTPDALAIRQAAKFPSTGWSYFDLPKWVFSGMDQSTRIDTLTVNCANVTREIRGLCAGDVNASYIPANGVKTLHATSLQLVNRGTLPITRNITFPVRAERDMELGAITLMLDYDPALIEIIGVEMPQNGGVEPETWNLEPGTLNLEPGTLNILQIGWMSLNPINVTAEQTVLMIHARVNNDVVETGLKPVSTDAPTIRFTLNPNPLSELADGDGNVIDNAKLSVADASADSEIAKWRNGENGSISVYPNPAKDVLYVEFVVRDAGKNPVEKQNSASLQLVTVHGIVIATQNVYDVKTGLNKTRINLRDIPNGPYMLKATVGNQIEVRKVIVNR